MADADLHEADASTAPAGRNRAYTLLNVPQPISRRDPGLPARDLQPRRVARAVSTTALARSHGVSPASASAMVKKLAALGLAEHAPYRGVP